MRETGIAETCHPSPSFATSRNLQVLKHPSNITRSLGLKIGHGIDLDRDVGVKEADKQKNAPGH